MKIKIALIQKENVDKAIKLTDQLQKVMEAGEMLIVDQKSKELLTLIDNQYSILITEDSWKKFLVSIRKIDKSFESNYLIRESQLQLILSTELEENIRKIMKKAQEVNGMVLQLPILEEATDV